MTEPYRVFDVVELADPRRDGPAPLGPLVVTEVREYPDRSYKYATAAPNDEDWVSAIYRADQLRQTGEQVDAQCFALPGPFAYRDIVRVADDYPDPELAGQEGQVDDWQSGESPVSVWFEALSESAFLEEQALTPTGRSAPRPPAVPRAVHRLVDQDGLSGGKGPLAFVVIDELDFYR
ncbi:MAG: hypothetical protein ACTHOD_19295 [Motilibacteraceae bacterium]